MGYYKQQAVERQYKARKPKPRFSLEGREDEVFHLVAACICNAVAVMLSSTSDGGALRVTLFAGEDRETVYVKPRMTIWAALAESEEELPAYVAGLMENQRIITEDLQSMQPPS